MIPLKELTDAPAREKAAEHLERLRSQGPARREAAARERAELEARLHVVWGCAFDLFDDVLAACHEIGIEVSNAKIPYDVRAAHFGLFARGMLAGSEILALLRTGHGHGALARWRTLFELLAVSQFLRSHGEDAARRYVAHYPIEARKDLLLEWPSLPRRDDETIPADTQALFQKLEGERARLGDVYGRRFLEDRGWAEKWIAGDGRISIHDIIEAVDLLSVKQEYRKASGYVHAGGRGALDHHRESPDGPEFLAFPSDELISRPGRLTVICLPMLVTILAEACGAERLEPSV